VAERELSADAALASEVRVVVAKVMRRLREQASPGDLTWPQLSVIGRLDRDGPATVSALARAEGVRPQSLGATVAVLQAAGLVEGSPDPNDGRQVVLTLTAACRKVLKDNRAAREDWLLRTLRAELAESERAELSALLGLLRRLADA
jgi:DNA-binding MarR family transcriptional regulator